LPRSQRKVGLFHAVLGRPEPLGDAWTDGHSEEAALGSCTPDADRPDEVRYSPPMVNLAKVPRRPVVQRPKTEAAR
jgi:hypothetical protein